MANTMMVGQVLSAKVDSIPRATFEASNTRAKARAFVMAYNNVNVVGFEDGWMRIVASPFVVDGPNGLRMNGFEAVVDSIDTSAGYAVVGYRVRRDRAVRVA